MGCSTGLTIAGGVFEVFGFALIAWELARVQRREFGTPAILRRIQGWVRRLLGRAQHHTINPVETIEVAGTLRARWRVRTPPGAELEERVAALEKNFTNLEGEFDERAAEMGKGFEKSQQELRELREEFQQQIQQREDERRDNLRASVQIQAIGTGLFVIGTVFSVLGNTLNC